MRSNAASTGRRAVIGLIGLTMVVTVWVAGEQLASAHGACRYGGERVTGLTGQRKRALRHRPPGGRRL